MKTINGGAARVCGMCAPDVCAGCVRRMGVPDGETSIRRLIEGPDRSERFKPGPVPESAAKRWGER